MTEVVAVEEIFPVPIRDKFTIVIPRNIRMALKNKGISMGIGDTIRLAIIKEGVKEDPDEENLEQL